MADGKVYKDAIVITTVAQIKDEDWAYLDLPFPIYGQDVYQNDKNISYELEKHVGEEVLAKVDYRIEDQKAVDEYAGNLGTNPKLAAKYSTHFSKKNPDNSRADFCAALSLKNVIESKSSTEKDGVKSGK